MKEILKRIRHLSADDLQTVMKAIERRYASAFPEWDVYYIALHKDPTLRHQEIEAIQSLVSREPEAADAGILYFPIRHR